MSLKACSYWTCEGAGTLNTYPLWFCPDHCRTEFNLKVENLCIFSRKWALLFWSRYNCSCFPDLWSPNGAVSFQRCFRIGWELFLRSSQTIILSDWSWSFPELCIQYVKIWNFQKHTKANIKNYSIATKYSKFILLLQNYFDQLLKCSF